VSVGIPRRSGDVLREHWRVALLDGMDLDSVDVTSSMVYWADFLCDKPASTGAAHEASETELEHSVDAEDADSIWLLEVPPAERDFIERLGREVGLAEVIPAPEQEAPDPIVPASALEAVPPPCWLKRRLMGALRRDAYHAEGFDRPPLRNQGSAYAATEAISLPAIELDLRRRPPVPNGPITDGGPG
jgi:hypothetical protein